MERPFLDIRDAVLRNYDVAFKLDWSKHAYLHPLINTLTMYFACKLDAHFGSEGSFLAYKFNERDRLDEKITFFRNLTRNEFPNTFTEEVVGGCHIFAF